MKLWGGIPFVLGAFILVGCVADRADDDYCCQETSNLEEECNDLICEEPCETECWEREICYEPVYYTTQKCIEKQIPVKRKRMRLVPRQIEVQRVRYVPEVYTEVIVKNEKEYYFEDDWIVRSEMVSEKQCEWVPKSVWKKVMKNSCELECEIEQDE